MTRLCGRFALLKEWKILVIDTNGAFILSGSRNGKYNGGMNGMSNGIVYNGGPVYNGLSTGPRPPPAVYQPQTPRSRTPNRTPRSRARARHRAREAGQFDLAPDQYSLHSRPASQSSSYRTAMRSRVSDMWALRPHLLNVSPEFMSPVAWQQQGHVSEHLPDNYDVPVMQWRGQTERKWRQCSVIRRS